jgi:CRP-like cAMP-binding protein
MALDDDIAFLARVNLFKGFSRDQLRLLAFGAEREIVRAGNYLFRRDDDANGGYLVAAGQINLVVEKPEGEFILDRCHEGTLIGEAALVAPGKRIADAIARLDSEVILVPRSLFRRMLNEYPQSAAALQQEILQSVRRMLLRLEKMQKKLDAIDPLARPAAEIGETVAPGSAHGED